MPIVDVQTLKSIRDAKVLLLNPPTCDPVRPFVV